MYTHEINLIAHPGQSIEVQDPTSKSQAFELAKVLDVEPKLVEGRFEVTYFVRMKSKFSNNTKRIRVHESLVKQL